MASSIGGVDTTDDVADQRAEMKSGNEAQLEPDEGRGSAEVIAAPRIGGELAEGDEVAARSRGRDVGRSAKAALAPHEGLQ